MFGSEPYPTARYGTHSSFEILLRPLLRKHALRRYDVPLVFPDTDVGGRCRDQYKVQDTIYRL
jgi:hypothetical protein